MDIAIAARALVRGDRQKMVLYFYTENNAIYSLSPHTNALAAMAIVASGVYLCVIKRLSGDSIKGLKIILYF